MEYKRDGNKPSEQSPRRATKKAKGKREPESEHLAGVDPKDKVENLPEADH